MPPLVFWLDVDNTLLTNDLVKQILDDHIQVWLGPELAQRYWDIYEQVRSEKQIVDIPLSLDRFREAIPLTQMDENTYIHVRSLFENFPFNRALYPHAIETLEYLKTLGTTVIVSDGDPYYQAEKILNSALAEAVDGRVLLYVHKQEHIAETTALYPGDHYVMIDDKPDILADTHVILADRLTTVFVKQGKYAQQPLREGFTPDIIVEHIGDLRGYTAEQFLR